MSDDTVESTPPAPEETPMEIHKPKHINSWRELLIEIGVVVIGVVIALGAEQTVEWLHWRAKVAEARQLIASELTQNLRQGIARMRTAPCVEHRLDELGAILDAASKAGNLPPVGDIGMPVRGYWPNGSWESVVASQTATHFPPQQLAKITYTYKLLARLETSSNEEIIAWNSLYAMVGPGRRLDPASEAKLRDALSQARFYTRVMAAVAVQLGFQVNNLGLTFSADDLAGITKIKQQPISTVGTVTLTGTQVIGATCAPIGKVPTTYGQGYYVFLISQMDDLVKKLPDYGRGAP